VIGIGNPLRRDDGVGWHAADLLRADARLAGIDIRACHQLTPELAADVAAAGLVVLVDAGDEGSPPGSVSTSVVAPDRVAASSHALDPAGLVALTVELFGATPPVMLVTVAVRDTEIGYDLSPEVAAALERATAAVAGLLGTGRT